jgi:hypothetical protein
MSIQAPWKDRFAEPRPGEHFVQLYREDRFLVEAVALFAGVGIGKGEAVVLIATPEHGAAIDRRLADSGFAVDDLKQWGQLRFLDAAETLARFMRQGLPDEGLFRTVVGSAIEAAGARRKVRAYGEMVNLLWRASLGAAVRLEELWNELVRERDVSLFCAYWLEDAEAEARFPRDLREAHAHVVPVTACA